MISCRPPFRTTAILAVLAVCVLLPAMAPATAATEQAGDQKTADQVAALSRFGKLSYESCKTQTLHVYYSCSCMGAKTDELVPEERKSRIAALDKKRERLKKSIQNIKTNDKMPEDRKKIRIQHIESGLDQLDQQYASIKSPDSWSESTARDVVLSTQFKITRAGDCRRPGGIREREYKSCMEGNNPQYETNNADYCHCVGDAAAKLWMKPGGPAGTQALNWIRQNAWSQCKP